MTELAISKLLWLVNLPIMAKKLEIGKNYKEKISLKILKKHLMNKIIEKYYYLDFNFTNIYILIYQSIINKKFQIWSKKIK